jgi:hypothetical protein
MARKKHAETAINGRKPVQTRGRCAPSSRGSASSGRFPTFPHSAKSCSAHALRSGYGGQPAITVFLLIPKLMVLAGVCRSRPSHHQRKFTKLSHHGMVAFVWSCAASAVKVNGRFLGLPGQCQTDGAHSKCRLTEPTRHGVRRDTRVPALRATAPRSRERIARIEERARPPHRRRTLRQPVPAADPSRIHAPPRIRGHPSAGYRE